MMTTPNTLSSHVKVSVKQQVSDTQEDQLMKRKVVISPTDILERSVQVRLKLQQVDDQLSRAPQLTQPIVDGLGLHGRQGDEGERLHTLLCQVPDALLGCLVVVHHYRIHLPPQRNCHRHIVLPLADLGQLCDLAMHPCGHRYMKLCMVWIHTLLLRGSRCVITQHDCRGYAGHHLCC